MTRRTRTIRLYWDPFKLRQLRELADLTRTELAQIAGLTPTPGQIRRWESYGDLGRSPQEASAQKLADALGVHLEDFYSTKSQWELNKALLAEQELKEQALKKMEAKRKALKKDLRDKRRKMREQMRRWAAERVEREGEE